ncbi:MAG: helix-turn-helix domain-containing protein, partial [Acutalibacteraceae bacterium]|nr:helix-turn-helix domain-containing protein [Acutalibacteraceae bacterium]
AKKQTSSTFTIPFNRQQLADFLSVDRSAMSNELCKMRDEGLIEFEKNNFKLL